MKTLFLLTALCIASLISNNVDAAGCEDLPTEIAMKQCVTKSLADENRKINTTYNDLRKKLSGNQKKRFQDVQLAWIKFKDLSCAFEASGVEGGSAHSMIMAQCLSKKTAERNKELERLNTCTEGDLSCPAW